MDLRSCVGFGTWSKILAVAIYGMHELLCDSCARLILGSAFQSTQVVWLVIVDGAG